MNARSHKALKIGLISLACLTAALVLAGVFVLRSTRFRDYVRARIIEAVEDSTGGRAEIGLFRFDWSQLRAEIRDFTIHGTEPAGSQPLFHATAITLQLRSSSVWKRGRLELQSLVIQAPQVHVIAFPGGSTNIPAPKLSHLSDKTGLETVVDLAIGRFQIEDGALQFADRKGAFAASGENLKAQLAYEARGDRYRGQISMDPLFVQAGANPRLNLQVDLPLVLGRDRIELANAVISTPSSRIEIAGTIDHLVSPNLTARAQGRLDLLELKRALGPKTPLTIAKNAPHVLDVEVGLNTPSEGGRISRARLRLGQSSVEATGNFRDSATVQGSFQFTSDIALAELARIFEPSLNIAGALQIAGDAVLNGLSDYTVAADVMGRNLAYRSAEIQIANVNVNSQLSADPHTINANALHGTWSGGRLDARATLQDFNRYRATGTLSGFDLQQIAKQIASQRPLYGGTLSGTIDAEGDLGNHRSMLETARARIAIAPTNNGVPVRGQIVASYNGASHIADLGQSFIALPSSRLDLGGAIGKQLNVHFVSRNFDDLRPLAPDLRLRFDPGGSALVEAAITGKVTMPVLSAHAEMSRFASEQRHFDFLGADVDAESTHVTVRNGTLTHGALDAKFQGSVGLDRWKATPAEPLQASISMRNGDVMDLIALAEQKNLPVRGALTLSATASGTIGNPQGSANVVVMNGDAYGVPIDRLNGRLNIGGQQITIPTLQVDSGMSRVNANATFQHPANDFSTGTLHAHVDTNQVALERMKPLYQGRSDLNVPDLNGEARLNMDADARLDPPSSAERVRLVSANGSFAARMLRMKGENLGDIAATIQTSGNVVSYRLDSDFAGSTIRANGRTNLLDNYETEADLKVANLPVEKALAVAGEQSLSARGVLSLNGTVGGTIRDPRANLDVTLAKAVVRDQPVDQLQGHIDYSSTLVNIPSLSVQTGPSRLTANASFTHPAGTLETGNVKLHLDSNALQLAQVRYLQQIRPGLAGSLQVSVDGAATLNNSRTEPRVMLSSLSGNISGNNIRAGGKDMGGFTATAEQSGSAVRVNLESNLAQAAIHFNGQAQLARDYPVNGQLTFTNIRYSNLSALLGRASADQSPAFDALLEGSLNMNGPALSPADLTGSAQISRLEVTTPEATAARAGAARGAAAKLALHNDGPVALVAGSNGIQVQRAHIVGPSTDISVTGNVALKPAMAVNVNVNADTDLAIIRQIEKSVSSSGSVTLHAAITGSPSQPVVNGRLELKNAAYQQLDWPNGISNANGTVVFTGTTARIESLTAESGGGRITGSGNVMRTSSGFTFNLQSRATRVLVRTDDGVSLTGNANLRLSGNEQSSVLGGDVTVVRIGFNPQSDFALPLTRAAAPMETPAAPQGLLANMNLDVAVRIAAGAVLESAYAQGLQAQADLKLRGNPLSPGIIGRVNVTQGNLVFFGNRYNVNQGSVTFYNPYKIEPILDLNLETTVQSVDVVVTVTGPPENMNLAYHSDPPLQFSEIVALLGAGKTPTSDPVLVANQPPIPAQSTTDMGASALLGAAVANPVAGQLQRVFGVSQLRISPTFVTGSTLPQAQVTLQQQVAPNILFTYGTDLSQPDSQLVRVEWAINPKWSAVASRDVNGVVGVDVFYKRRFR